MSNGENTTSDRPATEIVELPETWVSGFAIRTSNEATKSPGYTLIGETWERSLALGNPRPAAAYIDYERDSTGDYTMVIGGLVDDPGGSTIGLVLTRLPAGHYAHFRSSGVIPDMVIDAWEQVSAAESSGALHRAYTADLELYTSEESLELYIAIAPTA